MPDSPLVDLLARRTLYLRGKLEEAQRMIQDTARDEEALAARLGSRRDDRTYGRTMLDISTFGMWRVFPGPLTALAARLGSWGEFDRAAAARGGPIIRTLRSAMAKIEEIWPRVEAGQGVGLTERPRFNQLKQAARDLMAISERTVDRWLNGPAAPFDTANTSSWFARQAALATQRSTIGRWIGGTPRAAAEWVTGAQQSAASEAPTFAEPQPRATGPGGGRNPWADRLPILLTILLVAAGGGVLYLIIKDVLARRGAPELPPAEGEE